MGAFQLPWLPEFLGPKVFPQSDDPRYREAWAQPGALTAMFNYYRAMTAGDADHAGGRAHPRDLGPQRPLPRA